MGIFDRFKKEKRLLKKESLKSNDDFNRIWNMDIKDIWNVDDVNSFVLAMRSWICRKCNYGENISVLTPEERIVYVVNSFDSEVNNGGFEQFLYNSSGELSGEVLSSLTAIGANCTVEIYKKAFAILPHELPADDEQRDALLEEWITEDISKAFNCYDMEYYEHPENLEELLYQYIFGNKASFD